MLSATGDWYRLIAVSLQDDHLKNRRASASRLVDRLKTMKPGSVLPFVAFALQAVGAPRAGSIEADAVLSAMLEDEPSLDRVVISETLDPAICAAIALGEFLNLSFSASKQRQNQICAALAVLSAVRLSPSHTGAYVNGRVSALTSAAETVLQLADTRRRERKETAVARFNKSLDAGETAGLIDHVKAVINGLNEEMLKDREELQALWWVFGQYSPTVQKYYKDIDRGTAGTLAGLELSKIVKSPATPGFAALAERVAGIAAGADERIPLVELLGTIERSTWAALRPEGSSKDLVEANRAVFPVLSLGIAMQIKGGNLSELPSPETVLPPARALSARELAAQIFIERSLVASAE